MNNLPKLRRVASIIVFCLLAFYFLDFAGILPEAFSALGRVQLIPALMSGSVAVIAGLAICALLFGRVHCSFICPLGILQDIIIRLSKKKKRAYRKNNPALRWSIAAACFALFLSGFTIAVALLDPYSAFGRIAAHLLKPVYLLCNNALALAFNHFGNYSFYRVEIAAAGMFSLCAALAALAVIAAMAWARGRLYCNSICPAGTILGFLNRFALFKIRLDKSKCISCGACAGKCKASCIDEKAKAVDYSRCVNCFSCIESCARGGISFAPRYGKADASPAVDKSKRKLLLAGLAAAAAVPAIPAVLANAKPMQLFEKKSGRRNAISPPGAISEERLMRHCSSCHLCVSKCPSKVLKPAFMEYGLCGIMMPLMDFEKGFCNYDCTLCAQSCPSNALVPIAKEEKHRLQIGRVVFEPELCVVHAQGWNCGACSEHCPTQAVKMVPYKNGLTIPFIDADLCVGCGGCEFICPVRPERAIYVEGNKTHAQAKAFAVEDAHEKEITDFGF